MEICDVATARHYLVRLLLLVALVPAQYPAMAQTADKTAAPMHAHASRDDAVTISREIDRMIAVIAEPETLGSLLGPDLELSHCLKLDNGATRCTYWDQSRGNGRALALVDLDLRSSVQAGDLGGTGFWDARTDVCISPDSLRRLGAPRVDSGFLPGEPFSAGDVVEVTEHSFDDLHPAWGKVDMKMRVRNSCVTGFQLRLGRKADRSG